MSTNYDPKRNIHAMPIDKRIEWLMQLGENHSKDYCSPETYLARKRYLAKHPTMVIALKCMDGRIHIPHATKTPLGIVMPFRNIGGKFNLGWPYLGEVLSNTVNNAIEKSQKVLILITYHYSKGDEHRGCAGFDYNCDLAKKHVENIKSQIEYIFGRNHQSVYPLICGLETDEDALILHGENKQIINLADIENTAKDYLRNELRDLYPDMPGSILNDLLPLIKGNIEHTKEVKKSDRNLELDSSHREWIICIGRGFDFLHVPNIALIIGPYSPDLKGPISKAVSIIKSNMQKGVIPNDGFLLLASAPYSEIGVDKARAEQKSRFLSNYVSELVKNDHPDMVKLMKKKTAVLNWNTRSLELID